MKNDNNRGNRFDGPGRRTYDRGGNPPRVGRIARDVPPSRRVTGDERPPRDEEPRRDVPRDFPRKFHRGDAYRSVSGPAAPAVEPETDDGRLLAGRNPIREALKAGRPVEKLLVADGDLSGAAREIVALAKAAGAVVQTVDRSRLDQICPAHQGMLAYEIGRAHV